MGTFCDKCKVHLTDSGNQINLNHLMMVGKITDDFELNFALCDACHGKFRAMIKQWLYSDE